MPIYQCSDKQLTPDEKTIVSYYRMLNETGQEVTRRTIESILSLPYFKKAEGKILRFPDKDGDS
jgi:hypothetical protein